LAIIRQTNKKTGITYVLESESYWDKEKQQPRSRRKVIGKIDPETGEIVPTRPRKSRKSASKEDVQISKEKSSDTATTGSDDSVSSADEKDQRILELEEQVSRLRADKNAILQELDRLSKLYRND